MSVSCILPAAAPLLAAVFPSTLIAFEAHLHSAVSAPFSQIAITPSEKLFLKKEKTNPLAPPASGTQRQCAVWGWWMLALCACAACVCVRSLCACLRVPTSFALFQVRVHEKMKKKVIIHFFLSPSFSLFFLSSFLVPSHTCLHSFPYYFNCFHTNSTSTYPAFFSSVQQTIYPPVAQLASIHVKKNSIW